MKLQYIKKVLAEKFNLNLDVLEDVENSGKFGWEISNSDDGYVVDSKYGFPSYKAAEKAGEAELKKIQKSNRIWE